MRSRIDVDGLLSGQVPKADFSVTTSGSYDIESVGVLGNRVDSIDVAFESADEGLGEEPVELGGVESTGVFSWLVEGMQCWIEIA